MPAFIKCITIILRTLFDALSDFFIVIRINNILSLRGRTNQVAVIWHLNPADINSYFVFIASGQTAVHLYIVIRLKAVRIIALTVGDILNICIVTFYPGIFIGFFCNGIFAAISRQINMPRRNACSADVDQVVFINMGFNRRRGFKWKGRMIISRSSLIQLHRSFTAVHSRTGVKVNIPCAFYSAGQINLVVPGQHIVGLSRSCTAQPEWDNGICRRGNIQRIMSTNGHSALIKIAFIDQLSSIVYIHLIRQGCLIASLSYSTIHTAGCFCPQRIFQICNSRSLINLSRCSLKTGRRINMNISFFIYGSRSVDNIGICSPVNFAVHSIIISAAGRNIVLSLGRHGLGRKRSPLTNINCSIACDVSCSLRSTNGHCTYLSGFGLNI